MYKKEEIYDRLFDLYVASGLTLTEFGDKIGVTAAAVHQYVSRKRLPAIDVLAVICEVFDVSADYILFGKGKRE